MTAECSRLKYGEQSIEYSVIRRHKKTLEIER